MRASTPRRAHLRYGRADRFRCQFAGAQRVVNSFTGKRLHHARRIADEKQAATLSRCNGARRSGVIVRQA